MSKIDKIMSVMAWPTILLAGMLVIFVSVHANRTTSEQNNAYIRVINCIVTLHSANESRSISSDIEKCYVTVEKDLNVKLDRYND